MYGVHHIVTITLLILFCSNSHWSETGAVTTEPCASMYFALFSPLWYILTGDPEKTLKSILKKNLICYFWLSLDALGISRRHRRSSWWPCSKHNSKFYLIYRLISAWFVLSRYIFLLTIVHKWCTIYARLDPVSIVYILWRLCCEIGSCCSWYPEWFCWLFAWLKAGKWYHSCSGKKDKRIWWRRVCDPWYSLWWLSRNCRG